MTRHSYYSRLLLQTEECNKYNNQYNNIYYMVIVVITTFNKKNKKKNKKIYTLLFWKGNEGNKGNLGYNLLKYNKTHIPHPPFSFPLFPFSYL